MNEQFIDIPLRIKKDYAGKINLSSNELYASNELKELSQQFYQYVLTDRLFLNKYTYIESHRSLLAKYLSISKDNVVITPGSDCAIYYCLQMLGYSYEDIFIQSPNYFNYERYAKICKFKISELTLDFETFKNDISKVNRSIVVITNPNGFDGEAWSREQLKTILKLCKLNHNIVILDLAYDDFSSNKLDVSSLEHQHVIVIKTFSKSFASAGIRLGFVYTNSNFIINLKKMGIENSLGQFSLNYLEFIINNIKNYECIINKTIQLRDMFIDNIKKHFQTWQVFNSQGNFVCVKFDKNATYEYVKQQFDFHNIAIKDLNPTIGYENCLRITVPSSEIINRISTILREAYDKFRSN